MPRNRLSLLAVAGLALTTACTTAPRAVPDGAPSPAATVDAAATTDGAAILAEVGRTETARWEGVRAKEMRVRMPMGEATYRLTLDEGAEGRRFETSLVSMDLDFPAPPDMDIGGPIMAGPAGWEEMEAAEIRWEGREEHEGRLVDRVVLIDPVEPEGVEMPGFDPAAMDMTTARITLLVDRAAAVVPLMESEGEMTHPETGERMPFRMVMSSRDFRDFGGLRLPSVTEMRMEGVIPAADVQTMQSQMQMMEGMMDQVPPEERPMIEAMLRAMDMFQDDGSIVITMEILDVNVERES
jgi:hypothetical protein